MDKGKTVLYPRGQFLAVHLRNGYELNGYISKVISPKASGACEPVIVFTTINGEHRIQKSDIAYVQILKNPEQYTKYQQGMEFFKAAQRCLLLINNDPLVVAYMVNSAFACEIFLKGILDEHSINYGMTHRLDALFGMLPTPIQDEFIKQVGMADFTTLLGQCGSAFEEFRYLHENVFAAGKYNMKFWETFVETTKEYAEKNIFQGTRYDLPDSF